jgi:predicted nucleic acid-binding protein
VHDVTPDDLRIALELFEGHERLHARDTIHAATAMNRGIDVIISPDVAFDGLPGLRRLALEQAVAALNG